MAAEHMTRDKRFWTLLALFQVFFGLAVFAFTREYYLQDVETVPGHQQLVNPAAPGWSRGLTATDVSRLSSPGLVEPTPSDPAEIYRRAEELFVNKQYGQAASLYEQLLAYSPNDAEIYNNLGLTLFYLGRPDDALRWLNEGVSKDAGHQRIWLTLGYVNSQLGNVAEARTALTNAAQRGENASVREAALQMLSDLP
jgi:tetratricopeptide (TPR) repeat protein